jgi:hypothetical protein
MSRRDHALPGQLAFDALLAETAEINHARAEEAAHAHLPGTMDEALPYLRALVERHHAAMVAGDLDSVMRLRGEAHDLAYKLNGFDAGILADETAPGCVLDRLTRAKKGKVPLWGQSGSFVVNVRSVRVRVEMDGLFGIGASSCSWMGFAIHAVDRDKPFLSETGYRSFLGVGGSLESGFTPESFVIAVLTAYVERDLRGRMRRIVPLTAPETAVSTKKTKRRSCRKTSRR